MDEIIKNEIIGMGLTVEIGGHVLLVKVTGYRPAAADCGFTQGDPSEVTFVTAMLDNAVATTSRSEDGEEEALYDKVREIVDAHYDRLLCEAMGRYATPEEE